MSDSRWYFTEEQLESSPSRKSGITAETELSYRQRAANLIQEMGQRLQVSQLCINTAIVYMHRFYAFHSFTMFHRNSIAAAAFFLAAKVEEQPRKLEHVIKILNICLEKNDMSREMYAEQAQELVLNENILLQTLGFDVAIDHPHTHVVKACQLFNIVTVSRELRQTCYFMASNSLHLTKMCLKYRPTVVAAFCIYIACKWSRWEIPDSSEGKAWYSYVDESVTLDTLKKLTDEYLQILERSPSKFKSKMKAITTSNGQTSAPTIIGGESSSSSSHHKTTNHHDKIHHHHHHQRPNSISSNSGAPPNTSSSTSSVGTSASNGSSRKQYPPGDPKAQMHQPSSSGYKQNVPLQTGLSTQQQPSQRQRTGTTNSQQQPYSSSSSASKPMDERQQHRHQDPYSQSQQRFPDKQHRVNMPTSGSTTSSSNGPFIKTSDQKHMIPNSSSGISKMNQPPPYSMDIGKNMKQNHNDYHNPRSNPVAQMIQQQASFQKKQSMPPWQQQTLPPLQIPPTSTSKSQTTSQQQIHYMQKNLQVPHTSTATTTSLSSQQPMNQTQIQSRSQLLMSNSNPKQQQHQPTNTNINNEIKQNDFWINDKLDEAPIATVKPPVSSHSRPTKSLFSPSPEHSDEKSKYMMTASIKQEKTTMDSLKDERKHMSSNRRDKINPVSSLSVPPQTSSHKPQMPIVDRKIKNETLSTVDMTAFSQDPIALLSKKRPYATIKEEPLGSSNRVDKIRKIEGVKEPLGSSKQQPIETNPDIVKSLLQECFSQGSNKFDRFESDSPFDVINPELPEDLLAISTKPDSLFKKSEMMDIDSISHNPLLGDNDEKMNVDSSAGEGHGGGSGGKHKKKSKKKKEKHKHKKKHKNSDRESTTPVRLILSKNSSPESNLGGLKIKIPIKDVATAINPNQAPQPIKLKISKEKFGNFTNLNNNNTTVPLASMSSSSSLAAAHKKKDKDRDKSKSSKSSKHGGKESLNYHQNPST